MHQIMSLKVMEDKVQFGQYQLNKTAWMIQNEVFSLLAPEIVYLGYSEVFPADLAGQQAVDYMLANSSLSEVTVRSEIRRYLVWPGQATSYKMGMLKILELRDNARQALGEKFDIRGFHDAILGGGSLPLPILEQRVNHWVGDMAAQDRPGQ